MSEYCSQILESFNLTKYSKYKYHEYNTSKQIFSYYNYISSEFVANKILVLRSENDLVKAKNAVEFYVLYTNV